MDFLPGLWLLVMGTAGVWLLVTGWRGDRVEPGHLMCRRCGHDLFGLPTPLTQCPECGADLSRREAVAIGRRRYWRRMISGMLVLMLLALPALPATSAALTPYKPLWLLRLSVRYEPFPVARDSAVEIASRVAAGGLSASAIDALKADVIDNQHRPGGTGYGWSGPRYSWGDVFEALYTAGHFTDAELTDYLRVGMPLSLDVDARQRLGEAFTLRTETGYRLIGSPRVAAVIVVNRIEIDGHVWRDPRLVFPQNMGTRTDAWLHTPADAHAFIAAGLGPHTLTAHVEVVALTGLGGRWPTNVTRWQETLTAPIEILPSVHPMPARVRDDALAADVASRLHVVTCTYDTRARAVTLELHVDALPIGLSHAVFVQAGGEAWELDPLHLPAGSAGRVQRRLAFPECPWVSLPPPFPPNATTADVILRPAPRVTPTAPDERPVEEMLDHEFEFTDVPFEQR